MGLETGVQNPLGRIDVAALAPRPDVVVEPRTALAMQAAFQQAGEFQNQAHDRMIAAPVVEAQARLAADPAMIDAQKRMALAKTAEAEADVATKKAMLAKVSLHPEFSENSKAMMQELFKDGVNIAPYEGEDLSTFQNRLTGEWVDHNDWKNQVAAAAALTSGVKQGKVDNFAGPVSGAAETPVAVDQVREVDRWKQKYSNDYKSWKARGREKVPTLIFEGISPGQSSAPVPQDAPMNDLGGNPISVSVVPRSATSATGAPAAGWKALPEAGAKRSEVQDRAALALVRFQTSAPIFAKLKEEGFDPASAANAFQSAAFLGPLEGSKSEQLKQYEAAQLPWIQGVLRMESGAAISRDEEKKYTRAFFPRYGDSSSVQKQKEDLRDTIERIMSQIASGKPFDSADQSALTITRAKADVLAGIENTGGAPMKTWESNGVKYNETTDPQTGKLILVPIASPSESVLPYQQPARVSAPKVESKQVGAASRG